MLIPLEIRKTVNGETVVTTKDVDVNKGDVFSGGILSEYDVDQKNVRRLLRLPLTKPLMYRGMTEDTAVPVSEFRIVKVWSDWEPWFSLEVITDGGTRNIHHMFFSEMQSPQFSAGEGIQSSV